LTQIVEVLTTAATFVGTKRQQSASDQK